MTPTQFQKITGPFQTHKVQLNFESANCRRKHTCAVLIPVQMFVHFRCSTSLFNCSQWDGLMTVTRPIGFLPSVKFDSLVFCEHNPHIFDHTVYKYGEFLDYMFLLDKNVKANITFHNIYISFSNGHEAFCQDGYIFIQSQPQNLKYCGIYSQLTSYPASSVVQVQFRSKPDVFMKTEMAYSIIDANRVGNVPVPFSSTSLAPKYTACFFAEDISFQIFHMVVETFKHLDIVIEEDRPRDIKLHDGPGSKSKQLTPHKQYKGTLKYKTTKFQCSIFLVFKNTSINFAIMYKENYVTYPHLFTPKYSTGRRLLPDKESCMDSTLCVFNVTTDNNYVLNFSLHAFHYKGSGGGGNCDHTGLSVFAATENRYQLLKIECMKESLVRTFSKTRKFIFENQNETCEWRQQFFWNISYEKQRFPKTEVFNIYSTSNTSLLVWYAYPEYAIMNLSISVSASACKTELVEIETWDYDRTRRTHDTHHWSHKMVTDNRVKKSYSFLKVKWVSKPHVDIT